MVICGNPQILGKKAGETQLRKPHFNKLWGRLGYSLQFSKNRILRIEYCLIGIPLCKFAAITTEAGFATVGKSAKMSM